MAIWTKKSATKGMCTLPLTRSCVSDIWLAFEDGLREMFSAAAEELAMEEGQ